MSCKVADMSGNLLLKSESGRNTILCLEVRYFVQVLSEEQNIFFIVIKDSLDVRTKYKSHKNLSFSIGAQ